MMKFKQNIKTRTKVRGGYKPPGRIRNIFIAALVALFAFSTLSISMKTNAAGNPISVSSGTFMGSNDLIIAKHPDRRGYSYKINGSGYTENVYHNTGPNIQVPEWGQFFCYIPGVYESGYDNIHVVFNNLNSSNSISVHYNYVGTFQGKDIGANLTIKNMVKDTDTQTQTGINICESMYSGFWYFGIKELEIDYEFFYSNTGQPANIAGYMGFNSLNAGTKESVIYKSNPNATAYVRTDTNVAQQSISTSQGTFTGYRGISDNFEDSLGKSTFNKNSVCYKVNGNKLEFILTGIKIVWAAPSSTPITLFEPSMAQKTADKTGVSAGDELTYTVTQKVNTMGVDTLEKYSSFSIIDTLPSQVDYVSAEMLDASGNRISGSLNYDKSTRKLTYAFDKNYLQNTMQYAGEEYRLVIHTKVNSSVKGQMSFKNAAQTIINGSTFSSNTVTVKVLYDITTKITNGTITESMTDIEAGSTKTVNWKSDTGYYVDSITVDGKPVTAGDKNGGNYTFSNISNDHEVVIICKKAETDITLTKTIAVDDIYFEHGNPSFVFKVSGTDLFGDNHTFYKSVEFDEDYVRKNSFTKDGVRYVSQTVKFSHVLIGNYTASEATVSRYELDDISDVTAGTVQNGTVVFDLRDGSTGAATFSNSHTVYRNNGHNDIIINEIKK